MLILTLVAKRILKAPQAVAADCLPEPWTLTKNRKCSKIAAVLLCSSHMTEQLPTAQGAAQGPVLGGGAARKISITSSCSTVGHAYTEHDLVGVENGRTDARLLLSCLTASSAFWQCYQLFSQNFSAFRMASNGVEGSQHPRTLRPTLPGVGITELQDTLGVRSADLAQKLKTAIKLCALKTCGI